MHTALLSLTMLVQTNGHERTEAKYNAMDATAGFACCSHRRLTGGDLDVMLARN